MLESVNSISGENPQALEAKEEIKKINANPPLEVGHRTIIFGRNFIKAIGIKSPKRFKIFHSPTALLSFPSNPLVPLLKVAQISLIPPPL